MERSVVAAVLALGLAFGLAVGIAFAVARRSWTDYRKTKAGVPGMRKAAWGLIRIAASKGGIVILLLIVAVSWAAAGER